jgi:hypothetical protein
MATIRLPTDFKDFLKLLNSEQVEYLLVGGYAVGFHGYPNRVVAEIDGVDIPIVALDDLKRNKSACGREKDLDDVRNLP